MVNVNIYGLEGQVWYFCYALESIQWVISGSIYQIILLTQNVVVEYLNKGYIFLKMNKLRPQNRIIGFQSNQKFDCNNVLFNFLRLNKFKGFQICNSTGNMYVILRMCTSHRRTVELVAGETRKNFCTSLSEMKNESALNYKNIKMNWFTNDENLFERAVSVKSLKKAWFTLKSKLNVLNKKRNNIILDGVDNFWFTQTSKELLEGSFEYLDKKNIFVGAVESRYFSSMIAYWKMKIIEKALFNALEPQFEGYFSWKNLAKKEYLVAISKNANNSYYRKTIIGNKILYFKKTIICLPVFHVCSYGSRPKKSVHQALIAIKHWRKDSIFWINYNVSKVFNIWILRICLAP